MDTVEKARAFMYRNARPLDLARWQYHFEHGSQEAVLEALSYYQNPDGGFGHALEADCWNPHSSPIQTWTATEILWEISFADAAHPVIDGILQYLASGQDFDGKLWYNLLASNSDYPHAPWWQGDVDRADSYNPTACLAGFILRFADRDSDLYRLGCRITKEAFWADEQKGLRPDMHSVCLYIRLLEYCQAARITDVIDLPLLEKRLQEKISHTLTKDTALWESCYICRPSQFFTSRDSVFYEANKDLAQYECDFIVEKQQDDGAWSIPWQWDAYPEQWALSKKWWQSNGILKNLLFLKGMGRL